MAWMEDRGDERFLGEGLGEEESVDSDGESSHMRGVGGIGDLL